MQQLRKPGWAAKLVKSNEIFWAQMNHIELIYFFLVWWKIALVVSTGFYKETKRYDPKSRTNVLDSGAFLATAIPCKVCPTMVQSARTHVSNFLLHKPRTYSNDLSWPPELPQLLVKMNIYMETNVVRDKRMLQIKVKVSRCFFSSNR